MTIYADRVFLLNMAVDYLLLLTTACLAGERLRRLRFLAWSALGGLYATAVLLPELAWLGSALCRFLFGGFLAWGAYKAYPRCGRLMALFFLLSGAFAGILLAIGTALGRPDVLWSRLCTARIDWKFLLLSTAVFSVILRCCLRGTMQYGKGDLVEISIALQDREISVAALRDTGNTLRDPVNGGAVLVVEQKALLPLLDVAPRKALLSSRRAEEKMAALYLGKTPLKCCLLPFCSVGTEAGLLLAIRSDWIRIGQNTYPRVWLAVSEHPLGDYQALWNGREVIENHVAEKTVSAASPDRQAG